MRSLTGMKCGKRFNKQHMDEIEMSESKPFIRGKVAIESMRDNGFLSAAHALAELIDNSVQAGADLVEVIAFEQRRVSEGGKNSVKQINQIGVLDNGSGMSRDTLYLALEFGASENRKNKEGIGKFGMGLPNSSISQCRRVDVWSWTSQEEMFHTYLDIDEMLKGVLDNIPYPERKPLPRELIGTLGETIPASGAFVLWSTIDRCQWKTGKSIYRHTQDIVGRMYRKFIAAEKVVIRFKSAELKENIYVVGEEHVFKANDPLYLMKDTSLPDLTGSLKGEAMFEKVDEFPFYVSDEKGVRHEIRIVGTIVKDSVLRSIKETTAGQAGSTIWGKHAAKNVGISVVRAGRELSLRDDFYPIDVKQKARWSGIEISFSPALDNVFGVTNNKQHAVNLNVLNRSEDAEKEGFESEAEYMSDLRANNDPKLRIYEILDQINDMKAKLSKRTDRLSFKGTKIKPGGEEEDDIASVIKHVNEANSQREEDVPTNESVPTEEEITQTLVEGGADEKDAESTAKQILKHHLQVWVESRPLSTEAFFDVSNSKGFTLMQINENHVFTKRILDELSTEHRDAIEVCLAGWARMEKECSSEKRLRQLQIARRDWGQLLEDFLDDFEE